MMVSRRASWCLVFLWGVSVGQAEEVYPTAIFAFAERGPEVKDYGAKVSDLVFAKLVADPDLYLVDRVELQQTLSEQQLGLAGLAKPGEASAVGNLVGAKVLITGSVVQVDNSLYLVAKIIGTETGRVAGASVKGKASDSLATLTEQLADKIAETIREQGEKLAPTPAPAVDRVAALNKSLPKGKRPTVWIQIAERHVGQTPIDPAAETELALYCRQTGFDVVDAKAGTKSQADIVLTGEGFSEFAARNGGLVSAKARVEIKAVDRKSDRVLAVDRQTTVAVDLNEQIAGKAALQQAAASIAERLLPKIAVAPAAKE